MLVASLPHDLFQEVMRYATIDQRLAFGTVPNKLPRESTRPIEAMLALRSKLYVCNGLCWIRIKLSDTLAYCILRDMQSGMSYVSHMRKCTGTTFCARGPVLEDLYVA